MSNPGFAQYIPPELRGKEQFKAFRTQLRAAAQCCEAIESPDVEVKGLLPFLREQKRQHSCDVTGVSAMSTACKQPFVVAEACDGAMRLLVCRGGDKAAYDALLGSSTSTTLDQVSTPFAVHQKLLELAESVPINPLPPAWLRDLFEEKFLIFCGQGVAGAVAALLTVRVLSRLQKGFQQRVRCFTFGAPLYCDAALADYIDRDFRQNFYHMASPDDYVPKVMTLAAQMAEIKKKEAEQTLDTLFDVGCSMLSTAASVAMSAALPGVGGVAVPIASRALKNLVSTLIKAKQDSRLPLTEYKFGGTLILVTEYRQLGFVQREGNERVVERLFQPVPYDNIEGKWVSMHTYGQAVRHGFPNTSDVVGPSNDTGDVLKMSYLTVQDTMQNTFHHAKHTAKHTLQRAGSTAPHSELRRDVLHDNLLKPDIQELVVEVHKNLIHLDVYGANVILGVGAKFVDKENEHQLDFVMEDYQPFNLQQAAGMNYAHPLRFTCYLDGGTPDVTCKGGYFVVKLAFGQKQMYNGWGDNVKIVRAEAASILDNYATKHPSDLIRPLGVWGIATAQAGFAAMETNLKKDLECTPDQLKHALRTHLLVPKELELLDHLLLLVASEQVQEEIFALPADMVAELRKATDGSYTILTPLFSKENRNGTKVQSLTQKCLDIATEMLSKGNWSATEFGEQLGKVVEPITKLLVAYMQNSIITKKYCKNFDINQIDNWRKEKETRNTAVAVAGGIGAALTVVPIVAGGVLAVTDADDDGLGFNTALGVSVLVGGVPAAIGASLAAASWFVCHAVAKPFKKDRPGMIADMKRKTVVMRDWVEKLSVAAELLGIKCRSGLACHIEEELENKLAARFEKGGWFSLENLPIQQAPFEPAVLLQFLNYGVAGSVMHHIRQHLTSRQISLGMIGTTQSGKSTFCQAAFQVDSKAGAKAENRTRQLQFWTLPLSHDGIKFTLIDFPGANDQSAMHWYVKETSLASVLLVFIKMQEMNAKEAVPLMVEACRAFDMQVSVLVCLGYADVKWQQILEEEEDEEEAQREFHNSLEQYKEELVKHTKEAVKDTGLRESSVDALVMHPCCLRKTVVEAKTAAGKALCKQLNKAGVMLMDDIKGWCQQQLKELAARQNGRIKSLR